MTVDRAALLYGVRPGTLVDIPIWAALVEGHGRRILVDTGLASASRWQQCQPTFTHRGDDLRRTEPGLTGPHPGQRRPHRHEPRPGGAALPDLRISRLGTADPQPATKHD
jgi:hypothetical protein